MDGDWRNFTVPTTPPKRTRRLQKAWAAAGWRANNTAGKFGRRRRQGRAVHRALRKLGRI